MIIWSAVAKREAIKPQVSDRFEFKRPTDFIAARTVASNGILIQFGLALRGSEPSEHTSQQLAFKRNLEVVAVHVMQHCCHVAHLVEED
jgi:hypothetical protein